MLFDSVNQPTEAFAQFLQDVRVPGNDLQSIDNALQARFFQKGPDGQPLERWELKEVEISCPPERFRYHLNLCGFGMKTTPSEQGYARAAWPGALLVRAVARLQDLMTAWDDGVRWQETIVFGGKRLLRPDRENLQEAWALLEYPGYDPLPQASFEELGIKTELDMMRWLWEQQAVDMPQEFGTTAVFVDASMKPAIIPGGPSVRPTTEDTIREWLQGNPTPGSLLVSSGAPYGMAQDEAFWMLLEPHGHTVETFGHDLPDGLLVEAIMREVAGTVNRIRRARA
ncbi:MAG: hypothetical protein Q8P39_00640 [Candidatus Yanofskybacteria bacterium]|nr:hypothetical protein [Candidatus Yanofskybacteria bacterium]